MLADKTGVLDIAGKSVARLGFGTMRLTGRGIWGEPADPGECRATLRLALDRGVQLIDTADSYGPFVAERLIREALHPYPPGVLIATKAGLTRYGPDVVDAPEGERRLGPRAWPPVGRPEYLRQQVLLSLRRLRLEQIDLLQLHRIDPKVPLADQVGELRDLKDEGKIVAVGLSQVTADQLAQAREIVDIATVQSRYNLLDRSQADVLEICARDGIGFIPWAPLAQGGLDDERTLSQIAAGYDADVRQVALAWLLATSPVMAPIPGTSQRSHLEANLRAADISLSAEDRRALDGMGRDPEARSG